MSLCMICFKISHTQVIYTKQDSANNNFFSICEEIGSTNLLITNSISQIKPNLDFKFSTQILKINNTGTLIDSFQVDSNFVTYGLPLAFRNHYYLYGIRFYGQNLNSITTEPKLIKFDMNFNKVGELSFGIYNGNYITAIQSMIVKNNSIYLGYGNNNDQKTHYFKINEQLSKLDSTTLNGERLLNIINQGEYMLVCGSNFDFPPSTPGYLQIHKLDTTFMLKNYFNMDSLTYITVGVSPTPGSSCSSKIGIFNYRGNLLEVSNSSYIVSGYYDVIYDAMCHSDGQNITSLIKNNNQVVKTNILGRQNGIDEFSNYFINTAKKYDFLYAVSKSGADPQNPSSPQNIETEIMVTKLDTNANVVWNIFYQTPNYYYDPYSICATSDSGVVVCGVRYNIVTPSINGVCEGFVLKLDKNGNEVFTNITEIDNKNIGFTIYPNPTTNTLNIHLLKLFNHQQDSKIIINDILGKEIINCKFQEQIDVSALQSGIYFIQIGDVTKKFIKD